MARAILKRSKVLVMDEVCAPNPRLASAPTADITCLRQRLGKAYSQSIVNDCILKPSVSVDYATDELISQTIRQ
jgi:hypothetical protein